LLWIHGGKVINRKTDVPVVATWSSLNGYDETLTLEVLEPTTLHAFFIDTHLEDNDGEVTLSVVSLPNR
jgi:phosphate transport system substrate-binding protein